MPIRFELKIAHAAYELLLQDPVVQSIMAVVPVLYEDEDKRIMNMTEILIKEDVYQRSYSLSDELLAQMKNDQIAVSFHIQDIPWHSMLGEWRESVISCLAYHAKQYSIAFDLMYIHERGDYLYEHVHWRFDFTGKDSTVEIVTARRYDGEEEAVETTVCRRQADGTYIINSL